MRQKIITYCGESKNINEWAGSIGIAPKTIRSRIARGLSIEKVLAPVRPARKGKKITGYEQPCWTCEKACGRCSWSSKFHEPIKGCIATPTEIYSRRGHAIESYAIHFCPEYVKERRN